jgi:chromosome partitioning protein
VIPVDTQFREASKLGVPISHTVPSSRGAQAYLQLLQELLDAPAGRRDRRAEEASA